MSAAARIALGATLLAAGSLAQPLVAARAELAKQGDLIAAFSAELRPSRLPRHTPAAVAVRVVGEVRNANSDPAALPQLRRISIAVNARGGVFSRGLPVCETASIQPATEAAARRICAGAIVGSGQVVVQVRLPGQRPFPVRARLLAFNGPRRNGQRLILAQAYTHRPPGAFVLAFALRHRPGLFGTVIATTLPRAARSWAYITHFDLTLRRLYRWRGRTRSYLSAACSAPAGLESAIFPFARATYAFDDGRRLSTTVARRCTVRGTG